MKISFEKQVINASLCLTDVTKGLMKQGENGKIYLAVVLFGKTKHPDYKTDISIQHDLTKEERASIAEPLWIGDGTYINFADANAVALDKKMIKAVICVSDFDETRIREGSNGKKYVNLSIFECKTENALKGFLGITMQQTKEEREAKTESIWCGYGVLIDLTKRESIDEMKKVNPETLNVGW